MVKSVTRTVDGVDACLLVTEAGAPLSKADQELIRRFQDGKVPAVLAINKTDLLEDKSPIMEQIAQYAGCMGSRRWCLSPQRMAAAWRICWTS